MQKRRASLSSNKFPALIIKESSLRLGVKHIRHAFQKRILLLQAIKGCKNTNAYLLSSNVTVFPGIRGLTCLMVSCNAPNRRPLGDVLGLVSFTPADCFACCLHAVLAANS